VPYNADGRIFYTTNTTGGNLNHGQPVVSEGRVGVAVKTKIPAWDSTPASGKVIANNEDFSVIVKGVVQVAEVAGFAVGDPIYVTAAGVLTETAAGNTKFGRVTEIEGERGTPTNQVRIDLDAKDSIP
jgi:hypothetical protein